MASVVPKTVGESLYWSYANMAMAVASFSHAMPDYQQTDYIVRSKLYYGLLRGTLKLGSFLDDEKLKVMYSDTCSYCGGSDDLTIDHLIPQFKGGKHSADNLVVACRSCNSSKRALDLLEWAAKRGAFPSLGLLRRYLKLAIHYCRDNGLMDIPLSYVHGSDRPVDLFSGLEPSSAHDGALGGISQWPFAIALVPHVYPSPAELRMRLDAAADED